MARIDRSTGATYSNNETRMTQAAARRVEEIAARSKSGRRIGAGFAVLLLVTEFAVVYSIASALFGGAL